MGYDRVGVQALLEPLDNAVDAAGKRIAQVPADSPDYADAVTDEECDRIEEFLGVAFIACQVHLKSILSAARALNRYYESRSGSKLTSVAPLRMMKHGLEPLVGGYTSVEVINAAANYYKHRDEWRLPWKKLGKRQRETVAIIEACGAQSGSTGNMRALARVLGNKGFNRSAKYGDLLEVWAEALVTSYREELSRSGEL